MKNNKDIFKKGSKTFHTASLFFPKEIKNDVFTLYAYVRTADDFVDKIPQDKKGFIKFREDSEKALSGIKINNDIIFDFAQLYKEKKFERKWVKAFLNAMGQDLSKKNYKTFSELEKYMYGSAEVIGLMMARIMNLPKRAEKTASLQGKAFQLVNFIRDINEDLELGRIYIPQEDLDKFGIKKLNSKVNVEAFKKLIHFELNRYEKIQKEASKGYKYIPRSSRKSIKTAADAYIWTSNQIYNDPMIIFKKKVKPSKQRLFAFYAKQILTK